MRKKFLPWIITISFVLIYFQAVTFTSGPPAAQTGAPAESNCTSCHAGSVNTGGSLANVVLTSNKGSLDYLPDSVYTITLNFSQTLINKFGFQVTVLKASDNKLAGTLLLTDVNRTQKVSQNVSGSIREYIQHTSGGTSSVGVNSTTWTFKWKAPSTNVGNVNFYVVVMASNAANGNSGDNVYTKTFTFTPIPMPVPVASFTLSSVMACTGTAISASGSATNNPTSWLWTVSPSSGANPSSSTLQNPQFNFSLPNTYTITLTASNANGSSESVSKTVSIVKNAQPVISPGPSVNICTGDSIELTSTMATSYQWSNGKTSRSIFVKQAGKYAVETSNSEGCKANSDSIEVNVTVKPLINLSISKKSTLCANDSALLTATPGFGNYSFFKNGVLLETTALNSFVYVDSAGSYNFTVIGFNSESCKSDSSNIQRLNYVNPAIAPILVCDEEATTINSIKIKWASVQEALGYEVSADSGKTWIIPSSGANGLEHELTGLQSESFYFFKVRSTDSLLCSKRSESSILCKTKTVLPPPTGLVVNDQQSLINIYPNPLADIINISIPNLKGPAIIKIIDLTGRVILKSEQYQLNGTINTSILEKGSYFIELEFDNQQYTKCIIKL